MKMNDNILSVRELERPDVDLITRYWLESDPAFLEGMGVDLARLPDRQQWAAMLSEQLTQPYEEKKSYCLIWQVDNEPVGHSNVNKIIFGEEAYLHLWNRGVRQKGIGTALVKMTLPHFFTNLKLKKLYCEPYALNPSPNRTLEKVGFEFVKEYVTTPGWICFEQPVNLWELSYERFKNIV